MTTDPDTVAIITDLQAQILDLRRELARLGGRAGAATGTHEAPVEPVASRRNVLKLAGATAAGAIASTAVASRAAADGSFTVGGVTTQSEPVRHRMTTSQAGRISYLFINDPNNLYATNNTLYPAAVGAWNADPAVGLGIYAASTTNLGAGIFAEGTGNSSRGILAIGRQHGVEARGLAPGTSAGVDAEGVRYGVYGRASAANAVGVFGSAFGADAVGAYGAGGKSGVEGYSENTTGIGGRFGGLAGSIQLQGWRGVPSERTTPYERNVIDNDNDGNVWYCYEAGTPGKWRKVVGPGTAGAFHPIAPGRVYDSREALPAPGPLSGGQNRTISVADKRNPTGGAVTTANLVPAGATAVAANITVVSVAGGGFLTVNPGGTTEVTASTINWSGPDQAIANGVILALNTNRELTIVAGGGTTHVVVDITGYWL